MRSLMVSRSRASWALKLAISLIVLTLSGSLKRAEEARQVVAVQLRHRQVLVFEAGREAGVDLGGLERELLLEGRHGLDDLLGQARQPAVLGVDPRLQQVADFLFAVVAGSRP